MEVKKVREPRSPSRMTSASDSGLHQRLGFKEKTKAVIKLAKGDPKARTKAMKIAATVSGVSSVGLNGQDGMLVVVGDGVDWPRLVGSLRKKVGHAELISVGPATEQIKDAIEDERVLVKKGEEDEPTLQPLASPSTPHHIYPNNEPLADSFETQKLNMLQPLADSFETEKLNVLQPLADSFETEKLNGATKMETETNAGSSRTSKTTEWTLLITSLLLEGISASFDQLGYPLTSMVMAFVALLLSIVDLIHKARNEGVAGDGRSLLPLFYRHSSHNSLHWKPFGSLVEYFGIAGALWQCCYSTVAYYYTSQNKNNPIKMCLLPFIFALCVVISKLVKRPA